VLKAKLTMEGADPTWFFVRDGTKLVTEQGKKGIPQSYLHTMG
jgi:hypothetical protein